MGPLDGKLTRRQALSLAGSRGVALAAALGSVGMLGQQDASAGTTSVASVLPSRALGGPLRFVVHLPASYSLDARRYPVVYFLHGLPASPSSYLHLDWVARALAQPGREAIIVAPQGTRVADGDPEYHDWGPGEDWETAIAGDLPAWIDSRYRTLAERSGRAIVGYSAGGYGASIIGLHHPRTFAAIQSWSGYFHPTDRTGGKLLSVGSAAADADASVEALVPKLPAQFKRYPTSFAFYVGSADPTFVPANTSLQRALTAAGVEHLFRLYPGAHTHALWHAHARAWLALAVDSLVGMPTL
jgi:enterochelin esterase-like enzyme